MSQGLPVLYSQGQGFDGQFPEGEAGSRVLSGSAEDVAGKILEVWKKREEISPRVPDLAKKFQWNQIVEHYASIYRNIPG